MIPTQPPAGRGRRGLQRGLRRGRGRRPADVLRAGRRRGARPPAPSSATSSRSPATGRRGRRPASDATPTCAIRPMAETPTRYHVSLDVADRPGVLATVAREFAAHDVSISTVRQDGHGSDATLVIVTHSAPDAALSATVAALRGLDIVRAVTSRAARGGTCDDREHHRTARARRLARAHRGLPRPAAGQRRRRRSSPCTRAPRRWCRRRAPVARPGASVYLKVEGANPTGSFKDRGMTMAISKAVEEGARRSSAPRTGNTCASAAAYAARAGLTCAVLVPEGKIALGKLAQALVHGAQLLQVEGNFDDCLALASKLRDRLPGEPGQQRQPVPHRGPEDGVVRDRRRARRRPRRPLPAGRQRRQHHRLLAGLPRVRRRRDHPQRPADAAASRPPVPRRS